MSETVTAPGDQSLYPPSAEVLSKARIQNYEMVAAQALADPAGYWAKEAEELEWFSKWDQILEWKPPFAKWFLGAKCNIVHNCLDRHLNGWRRNKLALIWESETGETRSFSYLELTRQVERFAAVLKSLGVVKGDRVTVYMPRIPEQIIAILAIARLGAVHSVVFGGFSTDALRDRINDAESRLVITADGGLMNGKIVPLKEMVDTAIKETPSLQTVVVVRRAADFDPSYKVSMVSGRDFWYHELAELPLAKQPCPCEPMDSEDPLFILYTSGTTGKPKGILHVHGGYMVGAYSTFKNVFDIREEDRYWCTADAGWVTGHTYICYAPFLNGATQFVFEGAPSYPQPDRWWSLVAKHSINILYSTPTAIRGLMRYGEGWPGRHDMSSLRLLGSVGEPINPEAWRWFYNVIGGGRCPIMDTWWQTETGSFMIAPLPCVTLKPGTGTRPLPGIEMDVVDEHGQPVKTSTGPRFPMSIPLAIRPAKMPTDTSGLWDEWTMSSRSAAIAWAPLKSKAHWSAIRPLPKLPASGCLTKSKATPSSPTWCFARASKPATHSRTNCESTSVCIFPKWLVLTPSSSKTSCQKPAAAKSCDVCSKPWSWVSPSEILPLSKISEHEKHVTTVMAFAVTTSEH
jgi:acetyl-CoA synthetase